MLLNYDRERKAEPMTKKKFPDITEEQSVPVSTMAFFFSFLIFYFEKRALGR